MRIAVLSNTSWYLYNFRLNLMLSLQKAGHDVFAIGPKDGYERKIEQAGIRHLASKVSGAGIHPVRELASLLSLTQTLHRARIDVVLSNTPKGNIYSAIAAIPLRTRTIPNVSGLGSAFVKTSPLTHLVKWLYKLSFYFPSRVFFQNNDDLSFFQNMGLVKPHQPVLLPGSGVDLSRFRISSDSSNHDSEPVHFTFLLVARLLLDKGIGEYVQAARQLRATYPQLRFQLLGSYVVNNPAAISESNIDTWQAEGVIEYLGKTDDVRPYLQTTDCVVLPSYYREGTPRSLLEAAAMAKPIITANSVGCRNTVDDGVTGFLCEPRNAQDLADQMKKMLSLSETERQQMGQQGRVKMEREYDERIVIERYLQVINELEWTAPAPAWSPAQHPLLSRWVATRVQNNNAFQRRIFNRRR